MTSENKRVQRVERELFETLSSFLVRDLAQPLPCLASITAVEVNPNLRHARVYFRLVGTAPDVQESRKILDKERVQFQKHVARALKMKFCPVLQFEYGVAPQLDDIDEMLENLRKPKRFGD